jgi:hypothetical protein
MIQHIQYSLLSTQLSQVSLCVVYAELIALVAHVFLQQAAGVCLVVHVLSTAVTLLQHRSHEQPQSNYYAVHLVNIIIYSSYSTYCLIHATEHIRYMCIKYA